MAHANYFYFLWALLSCAKCCELPRWKAGHWMPSLLKQQRRMTYRYLRYDLQISQTALFLYLGMVSAFSRLCNLLLCSSQSIPYRCFFLHTVDLLVFLYVLSVEYCYNIREIFICSYQTECSLSKYLFCL